MTCSKFTPSATSIALHTSFEKNGLMNLKMAKKFSSPSNPQDEDTHGVLDSPSPRPRPQARNGSETQSPGQVTEASPRASPSGAIPRRRLSNPREEFENARREAIQRRRRLDSLNLETSGGSDCYDSRNRRYNFFDSVLDWVPLPSTLLTPQPNETISEGQELYLHFFHEQLRREGLSEQAEEGLDTYHDSSAHQQQGRTLSERFGYFTGTQEMSARNRRMSMNLENFQHPLWRHTGRDLRALAERFACSPEREMVRQRAANVDVRSLNYKKFVLLLKELFLNGDITRERILVLFFFCSDLAIRSIKCGIDGMLTKLTQWTLTFIREQVCDWVQRNGGWGSVFRNGINFVQHVAFVGMCAAVITACAIYVRKNLTR